LSYGQIFSGVKFGGWTAISYLLGFARKSRFVTFAEGGIFWRREASYSLSYGLEFSHSITSYQTATNQLVWHKSFGPLTRQDDQRQGIVRSWRFLQKVPLSIPVTFLSNTCRAPN
jgi:hypothetical protein